MKLSVLWLFFPQFLWAATDSTITVTADRVSPIGLGHSMSSSYVVTQEEIRTKQYRRVYEVLHDIPGVDVVAPNRGQSASVFIRGAKSEQTVVLIDGVPWNDPTDPGRGVDLNLLPLENVERVEVLRGAQSVLLPGLAGVINIITKSGKGIAPETFVSAEAGSYGTLRGEASSAGALSDTLNYSFSVSGFSTDGISASATGTERDGASATSFSSKLSKSVASDTRIEGTVRYLDSKNDLDRVPVDTADYRAAKQELGIRIEALHRLGSWEPVLGVGGKFIDRTAVDLGSSPNGRFQARGGTYKADWQNRFTLNESNRLTLGLEHEQERANIYSDFSGTLNRLDSKADLSSVMAQYDLMNDWGPYLAAGVRGDYHSAFFFHPTYRIAFGYGIEPTRTVLRSSVGTGFRPPSLYQLFGEYGNSSLKAEESLAFDFGIEQTLMAKMLSVQMTYFRRYDRELIDFDTATSKYSNLAKAKSEGVEFSLSVVPIEGWRVSSNYTFTESQDEGTGLTLLRRPRHKWKNSVMFHQQGFDLSVEHLLVGSRTDLDASSFGRKEMSTYQLLSLAGAYDVTSSTRIFVRAENVLDTKYQVIDGYSTAGLSFFAGLRQSL